MLTHLLNILFSPSSECEKTEETLMTSWYPAVTGIFNDKNINKGLKVLKNKEFMKVQTK